MIITHSDGTIETEVEDINMPADTGEQMITNFFRDQDIKLVENRIEALKEAMISMANTNYRLQSKFNEIYNEKWSDKKLQEMKAELEKTRNDMWRGFPISAEENKMITEWQKKHDTEVHNNPKQYHGASGGGFIYEFYPTGLGTIGRCFCINCRGRAIKEQTVGWMDYCKIEFDGFIEFGDFG